MALSLNAETKYVVEELDCWLEYLHKQNRFLYVLICDRFEVYGYEEG